MALSNVRLKLEPKERKKIDTWSWRNGPFAGTRELNGLRVLMAVINNWDLKDVNNGVIQTRTANGMELIYEVTDLGASFGSPRFDTGYAHDKGDLKAYQQSKFIEHIHESDVTSASPARLRCRSSLIPGSLRSAKI